MPAGQQQLHKLLDDHGKPADYRLARVRQIYQQAGVFDKACRLVDKYELRAQEVADQLQPAQLQRLFGYLIEAVLDRPDDPVLGLESPEVTTLQ